MTSSSSSSSTYSYHVKIRGDCTINDGETFTLYGIEIRSSLSNWLVFRRYRELHSFFETTQTFSPEEDVTMTIPLFPRKTLFGKTNKKTVEQRVKGLNTYFGSITTLCANEKYKKLRNLLDEFFEAKNLCRYSFFNDVPLMKAMVNDYKLLVHTTDEFVGSPLHYAAAQGHEDMTKYLLDQGANPVAEDIFGNTPLELARRRGHQAIVQLLKSSCGHTVQVPRGTYIPQQYQIDPYNRKFLVLVDMINAPNAASVHDFVLKPLFNVCMIRYTTEVLNEKNRCSHVILQMDMDKYDGIVCIGPDSLLTQVINALGNRPDGINAIHMPVTAVPCGEYKALSLCLNMSSATQMILRLIRGLCRPLDLIQVELKDGSGDLMYAIFSVSWGLYKKPPSDQLKLQPGELRSVFSSEKKQQESEMAMVKLETITGIRQTFLKHTSNPCSRCVFACGTNKNISNDKLSWTVSNNTQIPAKSISDFTPMSMGTSFQDYVSSYEQPQSQQSSKASMILGINEEEDDDGNFDLSISHRGVRFSTLGIDDGYSNMDDGTPTTTTTTTAATSTTDVGTDTYNKWWSECLSDEFDAVILQNLTHMNDNILVAPYAHVSDGCMDLILLRPGNRSTFHQQIKQIGSVIPLQSGISYSKVSKVCIEPTSAKEDRVTYCIIDGMMRLNRNIIVSVRPGLATLMT